MKIALITIGVIAIVDIAFEIVGNIVAKRARARFDKMSRDEQRRYQEATYNASQ